jgi:hypothetical protein
MRDSRLWVGRGSVMWGMHLLSGLATLATLNNN